MRSRNCAFWPSREVRRISNWRSSPTIALATSGSLRRAMRSSGKITVSRPSRSASSRAWRAASSLSAFTTISRLARIWVSSSEITMSSALTRLPSRTLSLPTTPPVGCCTFLTLESTTNCPAAITAPENSVVMAQPPRPMTRSSAATPIATVCRRSMPRSCGVSAALMGLHSWERASGLMHDAQACCRRGGDWGYRGGRCGHRPAAALHELVLALGRARAPLPHLHDQIDARKRARAMRDDDHDPPACAHAQDRAGERLVAFTVEIGIGLIQHDQERIAIERARERDPLPLPGRERLAALADLGIVAVRQA